MLCRESFQSDVNFNLFGDTLKVVGNKLLLVTLSSYLHYTTVQLCGEELIQYILILKAFKCTKEGRQYSSKNAFKTKLQGEKNP